MSKMNRNQKAILALLCLITSGVLLLLCSQSSPMYPLNVWEDSNCLMTVGRVMKAGGVVYRDIYEQKGPTLYLLHVIAAYISETTFLGVFILEVLSFSVVLYMAYLMVRHKRNTVADFGAVALIGACILVSGAFSRGDSAEEFCLPFLMGALYLVFCHYGETEGPMALRALFVCGLFSGVVATIKFTILGLFVGLCAAEGVLALRAGGMKRALKSAAVFLCGMLLPILAWCVYFVAHDALDDFYMVYIYNNVFVYSDEGRTILDIIRDIYSTVRNNLLWMVPAGMSMLAFLLDHGEKMQLRLAVFCMALCAFVTVYLLGRTWHYSPLVLSVFALMGCRTLPVAIDRKRKKTRIAVGVLCYTLALASGVWLTPNTFLRGMPQEDLAQFRLAKYVHEGASLLQYSSLDDGLYLVADRLPPFKYFVRLNVGLEEMYDELDRYVREGIPDYVFTSWNPLPEEFDNYQLIATDAGYDPRNRIDKLFYLYRRR